LGEEHPTVAASAGLPAALCLAAVPLLIALNGLASKLGDPHRAGRVVADTVLALTQGPRESLVNELLTAQGRTRGAGITGIAQPRRPGTSLLFRYAPRRR
jgi:hypothetical protein